MYTKSFGQRKSFTNSRVWIAMTAITAVQHLLERKLEHAMCLQQSKESRSIYGCKYVACSWRMQFERTWWACVHMCSAWCFRLLLVTLMLQLILKSHAMASYYAHSTDITFWLFLMVAHFAFRYCHFYLYFEWTLLNSQYVSNNAAISMSSNWMQIIIVLFWFTCYTKGLNACFLAFKSVYKRKN